MKFMIFLTPCFRVHLVILVSRLVYVIGEVLRGDSGLLLHIVCVFVMRSGHVNFFC